MEKQFRRYFKISARQKEQATGTELLRILERRLDNVVYRSGFAVTRAQARQMVVHGSVLVNKRKVNIPSFQLSQDDQVQLKVKPERAKRISDQFNELKDQTKAEWLEPNGKDLQVKIKRLPERSDINFPVEEQLVVELYSK